MFTMKLNIKKTFIISTFLFASTSFFTGCMTSSRQDQLQWSIDKLQEQVAKIQNQLSSKDQQINNTTQTAIASQNEAQSLHDQLQLTQGAIDEIRNRLKKIEENSGSNTSAAASNVVNITNNTDVIATLQKQVARLELRLNANLNYPRKGKMPAKIKNNTDLDKSLKTSFDNGNFKQVIDLATSILTAHDATDHMLATALEYRGEAKFQMQDYKGAASDLATLTEVFQNPPRKARALLIAGDSYVYLKNDVIAQLYYQDCVKSFATTPEGKAAASRLSALTAKMNANPSSQN